MRETSLKAREFKFGKTANQAKGSKLKKLILVSFENSRRWKCII